MTHADLSSALGVSLLWLAGCGSSSDIVIGRQDIVPLCAADPDATEFCPLFVDTFETIDPAFWQFATHTFNANLANFVVENGTAQDGNVVLSVAPRSPTSSAPPAPDPAKSYTAAEMRTIQEFVYGKFVARMRFASATAVISSVFLFHDYFDDPDMGASQEWNELVIEASNPQELHFAANIKDVAMAEARGVAQSFEYPPFDTAAEAHAYGIEWTPSYIHFTVDGEERYRLPSDWVNALRFPKRFVMSAYPSSAPWIDAPFDPAGLPTASVIESVEIYEYVGPRPDVDAGADAGP